MVLLFQAGAQVVADFGRGFAEVEGFDELFDVAVFGDGAGVLAKVFGPGGDEEGFDEDCVLVEGMEEIPAKCAVAQPHVAEFVNGFLKLVGFFVGDAVLDGD